MNIHIGRIAIGNLCNDVAGGGIEHIQPLPVGGFSRVSVDPVPVALHSSSVPTPSGLVRCAGQIDCMRPPSTAIDWPLT